MKGKRFSIIVPIYEVLVELYICEYEELPSYIKDGEDTNIHGYLGFTVTARKEGSPSKICIWIDNGKWTISSTATLVHELSHAVDRIAGYKGLALDTETRAYLLSYLTEKFLLSIEKDSKKSKLLKKNQ